MSVGPTSKQTVRRERAMRAKEMIASEEAKYIFALAEQRALKAIREAKTPDEAWEARALLKGHDEFIGLLWLVTQDEKNVKREIEAVEAQDVGALAQTQITKDHLDYLKRAEEARKET